MALIKRQAFLIGYGNQVGPPPRKGTAINRAEAFPKTNGDREGRNVLGIDRVSGMSGLGRIADRTLSGAKLAPAVLRSETLRRQLFWWAEQIKLE